MEIIGFEFLIRDSSGTRWVRLQGSGGQYGNGSLHLNGSGWTPAILARVKASILAKARAELEQTGAVREWRDGGDSRDTITQIEPLEILSVSEIEIKTGA